MNYADLFRVTLPETALEVAALVVLVVDLAFLRKAALKLRVTVAALLGVAGCGAALWALYTSSGTGFSFGGALLLAQYGYVGAVQSGILVLTAITLLLLIDETFTKHIGEFVAVMLMAATGGLLLAAAQDLMVIFIGLELLSLGLYIMTAFAKSSGKSAEAALKYYLFGGMSAAFLLFGFSYLYGLSGSTNLSEILGAIAQQGPSPLFYVAWILVIAGLGFKVAAVPFHLWAPDTYEGAPTPAAAFIASVSKVASFALLLTISGTMVMFHRDHNLSISEFERQIRLFFGTWHSLLDVLLVLAAISMIVGNLAALAQTSVRRLLAYSAIAHVGYILLGVGTHPQLYPPGTELISVGIGGIIDALLFRQAPVLYYILTYGLTIIGAFGVVSVVERATGSDKLDSFLGLHKRNPLLAAVLLVLFLSLAGIPPLVGFWAKFNLFAAVLGVSAGPVPFALVALAIAMSAVSLYYYLQVLKRAYVMPAIDESPIKAHPVTLAVLLLIAAAVVVLGCFPALLLRWIESFYLVM
ncbi:MAG: NADH-quinone oxidoreductase subunit N [Terracidiphilus sp.]|jgi:NADH-quinone oxidoreductase subunit N